MKYLGDRGTDLRQIHAEDVFGPSLGRIWRLRWPGTKKWHFQLFLQPACGLCLVKHLQPLVVVALLILLLEAMWYEF